MATGSNGASARALGVNTRRVRISVMVISSCTAALAGMIYAGEVQGAVYTLGSSDLLTVLAAVVIGGIALSRPLAWFLLPTLYVWLDREKKGSGPHRELRGACPQSE